MVRPARVSRGPLSRRLQYPSKNRVDFGCFSRTSVKSASGGNCHRDNALAPEVARHQSVHDRADFAFDSRRLHQTSLAFGELRLGEPASLIHQRSLSRRSTCHRRSSAKADPFFASLSLLFSPPFPPPPLEMRARISRRSSEDCVQGTPKMPSESSSAATAVLPTAIPATCRRGENTHVYF